MVCQFKKFFFLIKLFFKFQSLGNLQSSNGSLTYLYHGPKRKAQRKRGRKKCLKYKGPKGLHLVKDKNVRVKMLRKKNTKKTTPGISLVLQRLGLHTSTTGKCRLLPKAITVQIPGQGTQILQARQPHPPRPPPKKNYTCTHHSQTARKQH